MLRKIMRWGVGNNAKHNVVEKRPKKTASRCGFRTRKWKIHRILTCAKKRNPTKYCKGLQNERNAFKQMFGPTVPQFTETYFHMGGEKYQRITCTSYIVHTCCVECRTCTRTASQLSIPTYMFNQWLACPFVIYASRRTNIFYVLHVIQEHYWNPQKYKN